MFKSREIVIEGSAFDVDAALRASGLEPESVWRKGDVDEHTGKASPTAGLRLEFTRSNELHYFEDSDRWRHDAEPNDRQFRDAAAFLRTRGDKLRRALGCPGVERAVLSFGLAVRPRRVADDHAHLREVLPTFDEFRLAVPAEVIRPAGALGLAVLLNVQVIEDWGWELDGLGDPHGVLLHGRSIEISGGHFDPAPAIAQGLLKPGHVWRAGAPVPGAPKTAYRDSGVSYSFSEMDRAWMREQCGPEEVPRFAFDLAPPHKQFEDAADFLERHRETLSRIVGLPGVEQGMLYFALPLAPEGVPDRAEYEKLLRLPALDMLELTLPAPLVERIGALGLGVRICVYPVAYWNWRDCMPISQGPDLRDDALFKYIVDNQPDFVPSVLKRVYGDTEEALRRVDRHSDAEAKLTSGK